MSLLILLLVFFNYSASVVAQEFNTTHNYGNQKKHYWQATWVAHPQTSPYDYGVFHFRRTFNLKEVTEPLQLFISADNRYRVYVNGNYVGMGPARGDLMHWRYETLDIKDYVRPGQNTIAAMVFNMGKESPAAQMTRQTAFICQLGPAENTTVFTGDGQWKVNQNMAYQPIPWQHPVRGYYVAGPGDKIEAAKYPWGWKQTGYDDSSWQSPIKVADGKGRGAMNNSHWYLVPRTIPPLEKTVQRIPVVRRIEGSDLKAQFHKGKETIIPPFSQVAILLDNQVETMGYPELHLSQGKNAKIRITYAESLYHTDKTKGNRNEIEGKKILGIFDEYYPEGGMNRVYKPLWVKTFRYIQLDIETAEDPLVISDYYNVFTAYPFQEKAAFETNDPELKKIWDISWRTSRLCAFETYMDCPYFEQLNYPGDTRVQALISLFASGDDRLMKDAIRLFDYSRTPLGITQGRYPSRIPVMIPTYSLFLIAMLHDLYWYRGDHDFIRSYLPSIRGILEYYEAFLDHQNLLNSLEWWQYTDWSYPRGTPPATNDGQSAMLNLQYVYALQKAIDLFEYYGWNYEAERWQTREKAIKEAVATHFYVPQKQLYAETVQKDTFSQHTNIFAILTNTASPDRHQAIMEKVINDKNLIPTSIYFNFYFFRALKKAGLANHYIEHLDVWRTMLDYGYTTCGEKGQPNNERSDCHAWGATPCFDYMNILMGLESAQPGFSQIEIKPAFANLPGLKGRFPHPKGEVIIDLKKKADKIAGTVELPEGLTGHLIWNETKIPLKSGKNEI
ncbi:MAG: alpha-L-rhamnosidase N-terminal domain-containing protein [Candidatus Cyclobacteriaceae bacterium M3_2C_046]